jgi:hypothetical protein
MGYASIKTMINGTLFRSRLEAKWATFFNLLGWKYEYEPYDLDGWIPDFVLLGADEILVEVKPYLALEDFDTSKIFNAMQKTEKSLKEILLVGLSLHPSESFDGCSIGWLYDRNCSFDQSVINHYHGNYGFIHSSGSWVDRITGLYDGDALLNIPTYNDILSIWKQAGNEVQWKK